MTHDLTCTTAHFKVQSVIAAAAEALRSLSCRHAGCGMHALIPGTPLQEDHGVHFTITHIMETSPPPSRIGYATQKFSRPSSADPRASRLVGVCLLADAVGQFLSEPGATDRGLGTKCTVESLGIVAKQSCINKSWGSRLGTVQWWCKLLAGRAPA